MCVAHSSRATLGNIQLPKPPNQPAQLSRRTFTVQVHHGCSNVLSQAHRQPRSNKAAASSTTQQQARVKCLTQRALCAADSQGRQQQVQKQREKQGKSAHALGLLCMLVGCKNI
jgi:hypothetical protein